MLRPLAGAMTCCTSISSPVTRCYPRVGGDNYTRDIYPTPSHGTPPHAWGKRTTRMSPLPSGLVYPHLRGDSVSIPSRAKREAVACVTSLRFACKP